MNDLDYNVEDGLLACEVCLNEIPADEARNEEAVDYVMYYYGLACYAEWSKALRDKDTRS